MPIQLTADDARQSLTAHVAAKGAEVYAKYGPSMGAAELERLLADRSLVRYPCEIQFDGSVLLPGEFAHPVQKGAAPEDGFTMYVHPAFAGRPEIVPALVLYQLVAVNYGDFASAEEAEVFGSNALGVSRDEYYARLCELSEGLGEAEAGGDLGHTGGGGHCPH